MVIYLLSAVAIVEFLYIIYQDFMTRREREKLQLKLMSKDTAEYKKATEKPSKDADPKENPYKPIEDVSFDKLMKAKDNL